MLSPESKRIYAVIADGELLRKRGSSAKRAYALFVDPREAQKCADDNRNPGWCGGLSYPTAAVYEVTGLVELGSVEEEE